MSPANTHESNCKNPEGELPIIQACITLINLNMVRKVKRSTIKLFRICWIQTILADSHNLRKLNSNEFAYVVTLGSDIWHDIYQFIDNTIYSLSYSKDFSHFHKDNIKIVTMKSNFLWSVIFEWLNRSLNETKLNCLLTERRLQIFPRGLSNAKSSIGFDFQTM